MEQGPVGNRGNRTLSIRKSLALNRESDFSGADGKGMGGLWRKTTPEGPLLLSS